MNPNIRGPASFALGPERPVLVTVHPGEFVKVSKHEFVVKDSGSRAEYPSGMVRDTTDGKAEYDRIFDGPMMDRYAEHLTKAKAKYQDDPDGTPNWMRAASVEEMLRFRKSAARHFRQWLRGDVDEDHAAAVIFNLNGVEYVKERLRAPR